MRPRDDLEMFDFMERKLYSAVVSDTLDALGLRNQAMRENVRPIHPDYVVCGRVRTVLWMDVFEVRENPYEGEIRAIDALKPGDVSVHATGQSRRNAPWGELLSTASKARGARGAVVDGLIRDARKIWELGFPVFAAGFKPVDSNGRGIVVEHDCPIECGDVSTKTGDIVFGDYDGVVIIPAEVKDEVLERALQKVEGENKTREELKRGALLAEVYAKYGVL